MLKELLFSFKDEFQEKSHNPFIWTYFFVWCIRNWPLVYSLFNFDDGTTLQSKVAFISCYFEENPFLRNVGYNILYTLALLPVSFLLLNISRFIIIFSEKTIKSWVYKVTDKGSVVLKSEYNLVVEQRDDARKSLEAARERVSKLEVQIKNLEKQNEKLASTNQESEIDIVNIVRALETKNLVQYFKNTSLAIRKRIKIEQSKELDELFELGLIKINDFDDRCNLTVIGDKVSLYIKNSPKNS